MDPGWANRALYHSGFRPGKAKSRKVGRPWYTPDEILCLKEHPDVVKEVESIVMDETEPTPEEEAAVLESIEDPDFVEVEGPPGAMGDTGDEPVVFVNPDVPPTQAQAVENIIDHDLQFIDTRDSWTVDMDTLLGEPLSRMVRDRLGVLTAVGIDYEIRVWRTEQK